jgi:signal transduction histidine kinase
MRNARQAIEAAPERQGKGAITVSAETRDGMAVIGLRDDGPGIPPRLAGRLFEPFVSGGAADGTGLGLTLSRELAANHGGALTLLDTGPQGTSFELQLPH